ncbi:ADP-heptose--LPS heptosyltransferase 2 [Methyloglobulus morosus KoM1]|uniref:lipopolysaccharide heptosyltransferase II n=2 Tax=Methyloglobulus TaxID=1410680 RepID=V5C6E3_9GAMM|nr:ADP-heptose--LPS heptosyltransferase 2 [Methyloglobulus morosus KoM1]
MIMAQSLFLSLKTAFPGCLIDVLAPAWSLPLLDRMPQVANAIVMPLGHGQFGLMARIKLGLRLRTERYDQAIVLPNSWKSAVVPFFAGIPHRTGYRGEYRWGLLNDVRKLDKGILTMTVQRFVALGLPSHAKQPPNCGQPSLPANKSGQDNVIQKFGLTFSEKILALCPGAEYGPSKRWPADYFAKVAQAKIQHGWQVWLLGSEKDKESAAAINKLTNQQCRDFVGQTSLLEAVELMSLANTVVANDSGLMHLAAALNKYVIAIYGSTPPEFAPPLCKKAQTVSLNLPCAPCLKRVCPLYPVGHPDHTRCLTGIKPERILELIGD